MNYIYDINNKVIGELIIAKGCRYHIHYGEKGIKVFKIPTNKRCGMYRAKIFNSLESARQFIIGA